MHLLCYLRGRLVCVAQFYLDACDEGAVYPFLCCDAAGLTDDGVEIALRKA